MYRETGVCVLLFCLIIGTLLFSACGDDDDNDDNDASPENDDDDNTDDDSPGADDDDSSSDDDDDATPPQPYEETCPAGPVFPFDLTSELRIVPYPNDLYTVADETSLTGVRVQIDEQMPLPLSRLAGMALFGFVIDSINTLNGFSTLADLYVPIDNETRATSWPDEDEPGVNDGIFVMVDDPESPYDGEFAPVTVEVRYGALQLRPFKPLRENTHYVLVVTRSLLPNESDCYQAAPQIIRMVEGYTGYQPDETLGRRYDTALAHLETLGLSAGRILAIADFTTLWATQDLLDVSETLDEMAADEPPQINDWTIQYSSAEGLYGYLRGMMPTPIFQNAQGEWVYNNQGELAVQSWEDVEVMLSLPREDAYADGQPYPIVIHAHGVGGDKTSLTAIASDFAQNGFAVIGIDAVCHGTRGTGIPQMDLLCYFDFFHPLTFRDNVRETIANHVWLARAVKQLGEMDMIPYPDGDGKPDFDVSNIYFASVSLGSINGGVYSAVESQVDAYVLSSAGAKYIGIALEGPYMEILVQMAELLDQVMPAAHAADLVWMIGHAAQHILDASDPANYLMHTVNDPLLPDHVPYVLQQSSAEDYMLGGLSGAYFCRAGGWTQFNPYVWEADCGPPHEALPYEGSGFYQYDTDEHFYFWMNTGLGPAYREQALHFYRTHKETGVAEIIDPLAY